MRAVHRIVIIGAGSTGANAASLLARRGFAVTLIESAPDILHGTPQASFVTHADGLEYYKRDHRLTGEHCVDGSIVKHLLYPADVFSTRVATADLPTRFLVAESALDADGLSETSFIENARHMQGYFRRRFEQISRVRNSEVTAALLRRTPETFCRVLSRDECRNASEFRGIACGLAGSSVGINMARYYALLCAGLRHSGVVTRFNAAIESIAKRGDEYVVQLGNETIAADYVIVATGHETPTICRRVAGGRSSRRGVYLLNAMTFLRLPALAERATLRYASRINFVLQQQYGGMFACVIPPTVEHDGLAAVYFPSRDGCQIDECPAMAADQGLPDAWRTLLAAGLSNDHPRVTRTMAHVGKIYPFLEGYAEVRNALCGVVFNAEAADNVGGKDRRIRCIVPPDYLTDDRRVVAYRSPKWTTAELVALMALDEALFVLRSERLPRHEMGYGPSNLEVEKITRELHFHALAWTVQDARNYVTRYRLPEHLVVA